MVFQLLTTIPCQRFVEHFWQSLRLFDQRFHHARDVFVRDFDHHHIPGMPLDEACDIAIFETADWDTTPPLGVNLFTSVEGILSVIDCSHEQLDTYRIQDQELVEL